MFGNDISADSKMMMVMMMLKFGIQMKRKFLLLTYLSHAMATVESLKIELEMRFGEEQEQTTFAHAQELQAARMELDRAMDLIRQKVVILVLVLRRH